MVSFYYMMHSYIRTPGVAEMSEWLLCCYFNESMNLLFLLIFTGLISLLLLVGLLGAAAKLDIISLTVCGHCFNVFPGLLISMY